ncbi:hypothetical protein N7462_006258 [Penicillium macrosclerotiorum]|uniref:uncharacterized protein n=1 Tax=Penicillium macrosclerotiorum TaxID=303699 RepID=UPI0025478AB5|nr:uncharacterized protein N7462_006258 [Penicillium macrosclerotiorum]KAJ5683093.1 hypothetical protein N7462_006258 [Penicillium macrosclerotiorum]
MMRPVLRLPLREALYVCSSCRQEVTPRAVSPLARQFRRYASSSDPTLLERTRRKLWNTEKPPGAEDPYSGESQVLREAEADESQGLAPGEAEGESLAKGDSYTQAETWDGLKVIGFSRKEAWINSGTSEADEYSRFGADVTPRPILVAAHQATVEICLMHMLGKPLAGICEVDDHNAQIQEMLDKCIIKGSDTQQWNNALRFPDQTTQEALVFVFNQIGGEGSKNLESPETLLAENTSKDASHNALSLANPEVKFAYVKRLSQLLGRRIPDTTISSSSTVGDIITALSSRLKEKPVDVSKRLRRQKAAGWLPPNVQFSRRRATKADKDEDFGRKKEIYAELHRRGLAQF